MQDFKAYAEANSLGWPVPNADTVRHLTRQFYVARC